MSDRDARIEANFRAQYANEDDETLREIAAGDVPWVRDGEFLFAARRAARAVLLERGATDIPSVPWLDPSAARLPGGLRLLVVGGTLLVAVGLMAAWTATLPIDAPSDDELCDATRRLIEPTDLAYHLGLTLDRCEVRDGAIAFRGCVTLDQGLIDRLQAEPDPYAVAWLRRFSAAPTPGRHCSPAPVPLAEAVVTPRRPWTVRLAPPSTP